MCLSCGEELCKNCKECHNPECERYVEPSDTCDIEELERPQIVPQRVNRCDPAT